MVHPRPSGRLTGRRVLVTGASQGIGRAVAIAFAREGAHVAVAARNRGALERLASECGNEAFAVELDVGDEDACTWAVEHCASRLGRLDVIVHAAGIAESRKFLDTDTELWRRIMLVDVEGPLWLTRAALPDMLNRSSGAVIAIGSLASRAGYPYVAAYVAAKHALLGLMRALAAEYAASGVTFNTVCPWYVDTPMTEATISNITDKTGRSAGEAEQALSTPQGRLVRPEEVADVCLLLASSAGRGINGQAINIDGGQLQC